MKTSPPLHRASDRLVWDPSREAGSGAGTAARRGPSLVLPAYRGYCVCVFKQVGTGCLVSLLTYDSCSLQESGRMQVSRTWETPEPHLSGVPLLALRAHPPGGRKPGPFAPALTIHVRLCWRVASNLPANVPQIHPLHLSCSLNQEICWSVASGHHHEGPPNAAGHAGARQLRLWVLTPPWCPPILVSTTTASVPSCTRRL